MTPQDEMTLINWFVSLPPVVKTYLKTIIDTGQHINTSIADPNQSSNFHVISTTSPLGDAPSLPSVQLRQETPMSHNKPISSRPISNQEIMAFYDSLTDGDQ